MPVCKTFPALLGPGGGRHSDGICCRPQAHARTVSLVPPWLHARYTVPFCLAMAISHFRAASLATGPEPASGRQPAAAPPQPSTQGRPVR